MASPKKQKKTRKKQGKDEEKLFSILAYPLFLIGLIWYLVDEDMQKNAFAKFHFKQSLILAVAYIVVLAAGGILWFIPYFPMAVSRLAGLAYLVLAIIGMVHAANREQEELPVIGTFAKKFKF